MQWHRNHSDLESPFKGFLRPENMDHFEWACKMGLHFRMARLRSAIRVYIDSLPGADWDTEDVDVVIDKLQAHPSPKANPYLRLIRQEMVGFVSWL
jgi:hypothetical protein